MFLNFLFSYCSSERNLLYEDRSEWTDCSKLESGMATPTSSTTLNRVQDISKEHKRTLVVILVLVGVLCVSVVLGLLLQSDSKTAQISDALPLLSYAALENNLNTSVDPCYDFYEFACGQWMPSRHSIDTNSPFITPFAVLQDEIDEKLQKAFTSASVDENFPNILNNAILFYDSCVKGATTNITYSSSFKDIFKVIGGWPLVLGDSWNETSFDWPQATIYLTRILGIDSGFGVKVGVDFEDTNKNILIVKPPQLTQESLSKIRMIFYCVVNAINPSLPVEEVMEELEQIIAFETQIRELLQFPKLFQNKKMTISELREEIPAVDWLSILQILTNKTLCPEECLSEDDYVIVNDLSTLKNVVDFIENWNGSRRDIANFFSWIIVADTYSIIPGIFKKYGEFFGYQSNEVSSLVEEKCYETVQGTFKYALDYLFIQKFSYFNVSKSAKVVQYSKTAFKKLILVAGWIDKRTKSNILQKVDSMFDVVGYPKFYSSKKQLDRVCGEFPVMSNDVIYNYIESTKFFIDSTVYRLKISNTLENYVLPRAITHVSAYYDLYRNIIVFPLSIQTPPFFYRKGPWYLNFGAIGAVISHEINHGFDNLGHLYDRKGNLVNWWSDRSIGKFNSRLSCFKDQFNAYNYTFHGTERTVNGTQTLGENIADSTGLRQAYLAYKLWEKDVGRDGVYPGLEQYTQDQMFFISFASIWCSKPNPEIKFENSFHSPPKVRVIASVSNSEDFARAFKCPRGSPMNPEKKCVLW